MSRQMADFLPFYMNSLFEWIRNSGHLPILVVDGSYPNINLPIDVGGMNCILISTSGDSISNLTFAPNGVSFTMRSVDSYTEFFIPIEAVIGFMPSGINVCYKVFSVPQLTSFPTQGALNTVH